MQPADNHTLSPIKAVVNFRANLSRRPNNETAKRLRVATDLLERFVRSTGSTQHESFTEDFLRDFASFLIINGYSQSTILYNLKLIRILYDELEETDRVDFKPLMDQLKQLPANRFARSVDPELTRKFRKYLSGRLLTGDDNEISLRKDIQLSDKLFIYNILNGGGTAKTPFR